MERGAHRQSLVGFSEIIQSRLLAKRRRNAIIWIVLSFVLMTGAVLPLPLAAETMPPEYSQKRVNACDLAMGDARSRIAEIADPSSTRVATSEPETAQNQMDQREQSCMTHIDNATRAMKKGN